MKSRILGMLAVMMAVASVGGQGFVLPAIDPYRFGAAGPVYLIEQDFEGSGYDHGETWGETLSPDPDYTGTVLAGSQSLQLEGSEQVASPIVAGQAEVWIYFLFRPASLPAGEKFIAIALNNVALILEPAGELTVRNLDLVEASTVGTMSAGVTYHVWIHFKAAGGAFGSSVGFSTNGIKPTGGNNFVSLDNGSAMNFTRVVLAAEGIYDKVRVSVGVIGDNPL